MCLQRAGDGYRVHYAIADVSSFVAPGGALEAETWRRGQTVYLPDGKVPLHPVSLSEGAASLLPDQICPVALWTIDLDADGATTAVRVERALVRSRAKLDYADRAGRRRRRHAGRPDRAAARARSAADRARPRPRCHQPADPGAGTRARRRRTGAWCCGVRSPAEEWNAQISLLTGMSRRGHHARRRRRPAAHDADAAPERGRAAAGRGGRARCAPGPTARASGRVIAARRPGRPARCRARRPRRRAHARCRRTPRSTVAPPDDPRHGAVAAPYAHVTAPLRRLADRYATEVCLCLVDGREVPVVGRGRRCRGCPR